MAVHDIPDLYQHKSNDMLERVDFAGDVVDLASDGILGTSTPSGHRTLSVVISLPNRWILATETVHESRKTSKKWTLRRK